MSVFRVALLVVVCACWAVSVRGQDPTTNCTEVYKPFGPWTSDAGYWELNGLQSYYSQTFQVMCAYRGYYMNGPAGNNVLQFGPWHGRITSPNEDSCLGPYLYQYPTQAERALQASGEAHVNLATGQNVWTTFSIAGTCGNTICAGNCPGNPDYSDNQAALQQDPTYQTVQFTLSPSDQDNIITTFNTTGVVNGPVYSGVIGKTHNISSISSIQACYGLETYSCAAELEGGQTAATPVEGGM